MNTMNRMHQKNGSGKAPKGIQSLEIGFRILTAIQQGPGAVALKEIASRAGVAPSAAHNYLASYLRLGMVSSEARGRYKLGPSLASLGLSAARDVDHFDLVRTAAVELSESLEVAAAILVWSHAGPLILFNKSDVGRQMFNLRNGLVPLSTTAGGHVFAAYLPPEETLPILRSETAWAQSTSASCKRWLEEIGRQVRRQGYAKASLGALPGYGAISAPVWDGNAQIAYALSLSAPGLLEKEDLQTVYAPRLHARTRELSRTLGAPSDRWTQTP